MTDIAALGVAVDSSAVAKADAALDALVQAARPADAAIAKLTASFSASCSERVLGQAAHGAASAHKAQGAMNNNSIATLELFHVSRSLAEQFAAGVDPLHAVTMEFGRIRTLLQYGGGFSGVLGMLGTGVGKIFTPARLLTGALGGLAIAAAAGFASLESRQDAMARALSTTGRQPSRWISSTCWPMPAREAGYQSPLRRRLRGSLSAAV